MLLRSGLFRDIDPAAGETLRRMLVPIRFRDRDVVFAEGQPAARLFVITSGRVRIVRTGRDGRPMMLMLAGPADMIGALSLLDPGPRTTTAQALTDVEAYALDRDALHVCIHRHPQIGERLLQILTRRLHLTHTMISDQVFTDVPGRIAKTLLRLASDVSTPTTNAGIQIEHHMTQAELAALVGAARETVNKALCAFAARGWIRLGTGSIEILQPDRLARRAR